MTEEAGRYSESSADGTRAESSDKNEGAGSGDLPSIESLVRAHHDVLYRYAFRLAGSAADAEDLTQQTFLIAQQKLHQLRNLDRARPWLYSVLRSCFLKGLRKSVPAAATTVDLQVEAIADEPVNESPIDGEQLQHALNQLPDESRVILTMFYFEEASYKEIAEQLDLKMGTVMSRLSRAKQRLRRLLFGDNDQTSDLENNVPVRNRTSN